MEASGSTGALYELGTIEASERVLDDLYVKLRRSIADWAAVTHQTPQARMGYVGQHLTSVVTGYGGGRSGARGKDLLLLDGAHAEIKTCYRVDQLGQCSICGHAVASIELECPRCGSTAIDRKNDSKWLISPRSEEELAALFDAQWFYLVLFDFEDFADPREINARIWEVDPRSPGFAYCLVDYYFNIRAGSRSSAPFNLWPFSFKFGLLEGTLIYSSRVHDDDTIETLLFRGARGEPEAIRLGPLDTYARSRALTTDALYATAFDLGLTPTSEDRATLCAEVEKARRRGAIDEREFADTLAVHVYRPLIADHLEYLPENLQ